MKQIFLIFVCCLIVFSCKSKKGIVTKKKTSKEKTEQVSVPEKTVSTKEASTKIASKANTIEIYIETYKAIAMQEMRQSKIPASITLAQGILESGSGKGRLAVKANNHFGIKCHGWKGKKIYHDDDKRQECFRKYKQASSSYEDHSEFLTKRGRYSKLFKLKENDYKGWAKGLRTAGYATDRKYPQKLISLIERYELYKYDALVLGKEIEVVEVETSSSAELIHKVTKGDTLYSLSKKYKTSVDELKRMNNLTSNDLSIGQILIIKTN
jgi:flagellum-specific peptidoglycan hydrolase FlgJ